MKRTTTILALILVFCRLTAQKIDTVYFQNPDYTRIIKLDTTDSFYHVEEFYSNGQISDKGYYIQGNNTGNNKGMSHVNYKGWSRDGDLIYNFDFEYGLKINPVDTNYKYLTYTPSDYYNDTTKAYPLIIYLHGGSHRGSDLNKLYGKKSID
jgi:hypothetical protein